MWTIVIINLLQHVKESCEMNKDEIKQKRNLYKMNCALKTGLTHVPFLTRFLERHDRAELGIDVNTSCMIEELSEFVRGSKHLNYVNNIVSSGSRI